MFKNRIKVSVDLNNSIKSAAKKITGKTGEEIPRSVEEKWRDLKAVSMLEDFKLSAVEGLEELRKLTKIEFREDQGTLLANYQEINDNAKDGNALPGKKRTLKRTKRMTKIDFDSIRSKIFSDEEMRLRAEAAKKSDSESA